MRKESQGQTFFTLDPKKKKGHTPKSVPNIIIVLILQLQYNGRGTTSLAKDGPTWIIYSKES